MPRRSALNSTTLSHVVPAKMFLHALITLAWPASATRLTLYGTLNTSTADHACRGSMSACPMWPGPSMPPGWEITWSAQAP
eukprot:4180834-Pyramimonas_sp.AAC.1